jgi:hypothetical protein
VEELEFQYQPLGTADEELAEVVEFINDLPETELEYLLNHPEEVLGIIPDPDADEVDVIPVPEVGRNDACPCGSGKKFKKCCINKAYIQIPKTAVDWMGNPIPEKNFLANSFLEAGYLHEEAGDESAQMAAWMFFAAFLVETIPAHLTNPDDIEKRKIFSGTEKVTVWINQFLRLATKTILENEMGGSLVQGPVLWMNDQFTHASGQLREQLVLTRGILYSTYEDKMSEAVQDFRKVLDWRPDNLVAITMLAALYLDVADEPNMEAAREVLEQGVNVSKTEEDKSRFQRQLDDLAQKYGESV